MSFNKLKIASLLAMLTAISWTGTAAALDIGFEGLLSAERSDNVNGANSPDEEDGTTIGGLLGVYGEQRSRRVDAAFAGEIDTRRINTDAGSSNDTITRFLGAADVSLTPRSWRWYFGDILGGVRNDNAIQSIDDAVVDRRNVFVTGPTFAYDVADFSRTRARLMYVNQTEEDQVIESLYTASFSYERDITPGSYFGVRLANIYTDAPSEEDAQIAGVSDQDFNRASVSAYWNRVQGFLELYGELGATRYDADQESLNGLSAQLRATRRLGRQSSVSLRLTRDLNDQTLSTIESLIDGAGESVGLRPEVAGFFTDTRLALEYSFQTSLISFTFGAGVGQLDYQLLATELNAGLSADNQDQTQGFAFASISRRFTTRLRSELAINYEQQTYDNLNDETDSILATARIIYRLTRSLELEGSVRRDTASGLLTRFGGGTTLEEDIDITENRFAIGLRWAPPSRASRDLTVELKSLLQ